MFFIQSSILAQEMACAARAVARAGSPAPTSARGPAAVEKSQAQRVTEYNEFYGGVRCYTYISRRAELTHL